MSAPPAHPFFLHASAAMAALLSEFDWAGSGFGSPQTWPPHLRTVAAMLFDSTEPMRLAWGPRRLMLYNEAYASILGQRHPAAFGQPMAEVWPDIWESVSPRLDKVFAGQSQHSNDTVYRIERNGYPEQVHVSYTYLPVRDAQGGIDAALCICSEITAQVMAAHRQAAENLQATEKMRQLADSLEQRVDERSRELAHWWRSAPYLKVVTDHALRIQALNPAWGSLLGHDQSLVGQPFVTLIHPEDSDAAHQAIGSVARDAHASVRLRTRQRDGAWRHISWIISLEAATGRYYAMGRDLSEERAGAEALANAEAQLRQSQKMEAIGQLTGGIAHDFNNMLQGIVMPLQLIQRKAQSGDVAEVERYVSAGLASAQRAAALTQRLLAFSRRQPLDSRPTDVGHALADLQPMLASTLGENIALALDIAPELWTATTDLHQFENAVLNLAINARDAMPDGGELSIVAENVALTAKAVAGVHGLPAGDYVRVVVRDTGVGMAGDVLLKAFDPFFTTKPLGQGTGLGLSMIYGYARQSGGYVALDSEAGVGTVVRLYLPRSDGDNAAPPEPVYADLAPSGDGNARPESVLVVEDDETVRDLVVELLRGQGLQVMEASTGGEGMQLLSGALRFDLLLTDVGLPGPNGRQLADYAQERLPGIRIVLMTGYAEQASMRAQFLGDTMELLVKPFGTEQLLAKVRNALARMPSPGADSFNAP